MALPEHLFSSEDGALYDTRQSDWSKRAPLRSTYKRHAGEISPGVRGLQEIKATLRAGSYAWPGGYPLYFITRDGDALSFDAVREQLRNVAYDLLNDVSTGWRVEGVDTNYEDVDLWCAHTNKRIPSAYAEPEDVESD
jgi:hypothetical protein